MTDTTALTARFDALGPWFTRFEVDGESYGGANSYVTDYRLELFFEWMGEPATILELSSFEAGHTVPLAAPSFVQRVVGLEGRIENIRRAELVVELLGRGNVEFAHLDLDDASASLKPFGRFDAVFCAGLLYCLTRPWQLIRKIAAVTDRLFLDTHFSRTAEIAVDGYEGASAAEGGYGDVLSGLSPSSFWMTLPCLTQTLNDAGFTIIHQYIVEDWAGAGPRIHLAAITE